MVPEYLRLNRAKMGTSSKTQFTLTVRTVSVYKRFDRHFVHFIVLGV